LQTACDLPSAMAICHLLISCGARRHAIRHLPFAADCKWHAICHLPRGGFNAAARHLKSAVVQTGWRRPIGCHIFKGHCPRTSPVISGVLAERDMHFKAFYASSPPCTDRCTPYATRNQPQPIWIHFESLGSAGTRVFTQPDKHQENTHPLKKPS